MQETFKTGEFPNPSIFPRQLQILSGSSLKLLAVVFMFIDHLGAIILRHYPPANQVVLKLFQNNYSIYMISRGVGRLAFPIFCFLLVEGFRHTHDRLKYARNLLIFALISEIPWNYAAGRSLRYGKQNVYFTLLIGFVTMYLLQKAKDSYLLQTIIVFGMLFVSVRFNADYSYRGYIFIMIMYYLQDRRPAQALIGSCWLKYEWAAGFAFIPINMYNGKRGFVQSRILKYSFYAFYPVHLALLALLRWHLYHV